MHSPRPALRSYASICHSAKGARMDRLLAEVQAETATDSDERSL